MNKSGGSPLIPQSLSISLLGTGGSGKSAITVRYVHERFTIKYDPTIEDSYRRQIRYRESSVELEIFDTAGQEEYASITDGYARTSDVCILVCAVDANDPLGTIRQWHRRVTRLCEVRNKPPLAVVIAINKIDLLPDSAIKKQNSGYIEPHQIDPSIDLENSSSPTRFASDEDRMRSNRVLVSAYARKHRLAYVVTSAKSGKNIDALFNKAIEVAIEARAPASARRRSITIGTATKFREGDAIASPSKRKSGRPTETIISASTNEKEEEEENQKKSGCILL